MRALLTEGRLVQPLTIAAGMRQNRQLVLAGKAQLRRIGTTKMMGISCGEHLEPVREEELSDKDRHIFIEVQPDKKRGFDHWRRG